MFFKKLTLHVPSPRGAESWMMEGGSAGVMKLQELPLGSTSRSTSYGVFGIILGFSEICPHPTALPILPSNLVSDVPFVEFSNGDINVTLILSNNIFGKGGHYHLFLVESAYHPLGKP